LDFLLFPETCLTAQRFCETKKRSRSDAMLTEVHFDARPIDTTRAVGEASRTTSTCAWEDLWQTARLWQPRFVNTEGKNHLSCVRSITQQFIGER